MFVLVLNVEHKGDTRGVLGHHFLKKAWREVDPFDHEWLITLVKRVNHLGKFFCDQSTLLLVAFQRDPWLACVLPIFLRHRVTCLVRWAKERRIGFLLEEVAHHVPHWISRQDSWDSETCAKQGGKCTLTCTWRACKKYDHVYLGLHEKRRYQKVFETVWFLVIIHLEAVVQNALQCWHRCGDLLNHTNFRTVLKRRWGNFILTFLRDYLVFIARWVRFLFLQLNRIIFLLHLFTGSDLWNLATLGALKNLV